MNRRVVPPPQETGTGARGAVGGAAAGTAWEDTGSLVGAIAGDEEGFIVFGACTLT
jgi:hypothetical protein